MTNRSYGQMEMNQPVLVCLLLPKGLQCQIPKHAGCQESLPVAKRRAVGAKQSPAGVSSLRWPHANHTAETQALPGCSHTQLDTASSILTTGR